MRKIISKVALWMILASTIAIPQAFASSVELTADSTTITAGDTVTVQLTDVGVDSTIVASVAVDFDWADGSETADVVCTGTMVEDGTYTYTCTASHQYTTVGDYEIFAETHEYNLDDTTSRLDSTLSISVLPVPLAVEAGADQAIYTGQTISISPTSTGGDGTLDWAQVEWNDGSMYDFYNALSAGDLAITPTHTFTTAGVYTVTVTATDGVTTSSDTLTVTVTDMPLPDLTVSALEYNEDTGTIYYTLTNQGGEVAEGTDGVTQLYYDGVEGSYYMWSWYGDTDFFSIGGSTQYVSSVIPEGTSVVTVCVDDDGLVTESNETNNCMSLSLLPDLTVTSVSYDISTGVLDYTLSNDSQIGISEDTDGHNAINIIGLDGTTTTQSFAWSTLADKTFLSAGSSSDFSFGMGGYDVADLSSIEVCTDSLEVVTEGDETNNCMSLSLLPDLTVAITGYDTASGVLDYTVSNDGANSVDASTSGVNMITITNLDGTSVTRSYSWDVSGDLNFLSAGGSSDFSFGAGTMDTSIIYTIEVCTDATELVTEDSEQNNCAVQVVNERPEVDLAPTGITVNSTTGVVSYALSNLGTDNLTADDSSVTTITINETTVLTDSPELTSDGAFMVAGGTSTIDVTTLTASGLYLVTVCADSSNDIYETNESNNCLSALLNYNYTTDTDGGDDDGGGNTNDNGGSTSSNNTGGASYGGGAGAVGGYGNNYSSGNQDVVIAEEGGSTTGGGCGEMPFTDVNPNASYYDAIYNAWCEGTVHGRTPTSFAPSATMLRSEVAKVVAITFGYIPVTSLDWTPYTDVDPSLDMAPYVLSLTEAGVLDGYDDGSFGYGDGMTVSDIEELLGNVLGTAVDVSAYSDDGNTVTRGRFMEFIAKLTD